VDAVSSLKCDGGKRCRGVKGVWEGGEGEGRGDKELDEGCRLPYESHWTFGLLSVVVVPVYWME